jgi:hypothetical protein
MDGKELSDFLNVEQWEEIHGLHSIHGPMCPHCQKLLPRAFCGRRGSGPYFCTNCVQGFRAAICDRGGKKTFLTYKLKTAWVVVRRESTSDLLVLRDDSETLGGPTITNSAESVVHELYTLGLLWQERRLRYHSTDGRFDWMEHFRGTFMGFRPGD